MMLSVAFFIAMLNVSMLSVVMLSVVTPDCSLALPACPALVVYLWLSASHAKNLG
jgi:hypothetical protein